MNAAEAYDSLMMRHDEPACTITTTKWLNNIGIPVQGPGPWLISKTKTGFTIEELPEKQSDN